ncbi:MAG: hypothetical protein ABL903_16735 [Methylococcales bacterium]
MATQLIKHLEECAKNDTVYKPLEAQWAFDEKLIAKALQNVGAYFPNYSRHDESHSRQILVHIERLLGKDNILQLSATDTWLLLEAAYLHDIGMVVTDEQLNNDFEDIKKHVKKTKHLAHDDTLTIMDALLNSKTSIASSIFTTANIPPFYALKILREIIAEYYRAKHPEQANKIIPNPFEEIGLNSPRNELLPARLFSLLGKICAYHGADFKSVMELPKQQVGIGTDDCHPRFVACLLRLGDLLDLDDNRFCPVMLKMAGKLPDRSKAHHDKHLAIRHFRADLDRIEIEAECPSYESYLATTQWFELLREEIKNQMIYWFDIVPSRDFGLLPSVGDLKVELKPWALISENERPHFELNRERIFELLQGAGLYENKEQALRELLQNAVDATLIRIWRQYGEDCVPRIDQCIKRDSSPRSEEVQKLLEANPIDVKFEKLQEDAQYNYWRFTIIDSGTGISRGDLKYMLQMGGSKNNSSRRAIIDKMPIWMKPSGIFGIGLHSAFLLTDEVWLKTRSIDTGETLVIRLTNPTDSKEKGYVYFRHITESTEMEFGNLCVKEHIQPWDFSRFGCELSFIYKSDKRQLQKKSAHKSAENIFKNYDGLIKELFDFNVQLIIFEIAKFFKEALLEASLEITDTGNNQQIPLSKNCTVRNQYYSAKQQMEISIAKITINEERPYQDLVQKENTEAVNRFIVPTGSLYAPIDYTQLGQIRFRYRGQPITEWRIRLKLLSMTVNLFDDEADKILTLNRNNFRDGEEKQKLLTRVSLAVQDFFISKDGEKYYNALEKEADKAVIAAEYEIQGWSRPEYFTVEWSRILISVSKEDSPADIPLEELSDYQTIIIPKDTWSDEQDRHYDCPTYVPEKYKNNSTIRIAITGLCDENGKCINTVYTLVSKFLKNKGFSPVYCDDELFVELNKTNPQPLPDEVIKKYCKDLCANNPETLSLWLKRESIPIPLEEYKILELADNDYFTIQGNSYPLKSAFALDQISPRMLFPLAKIDDKLTVGDLDKLAQCVYLNRKDIAITEEQIKDKYREFISFLDKLMEEDAKWNTLRGDEVN